MPLVWAQRQEELLSDCVVSPDIFKYMGGLDHGVGHCIEMTSQKGLQSGNSLAIFSHDIHA